MLLDLLDVGSSGTLRPLFNAELDAVTFAQAPEAGRDDGGLVNKYILVTGFGCNEPKAFLIIEPLDCSTCLAVTHGWKTPFPFVIHATKYKYKTWSFLTKIFVLLRK